MEKKNVVLLTVIAVATLLITVVGATFAYFAATIDNEKNETIKITSANDLTLTYNGGETIGGSNVLPGWGVNYEITVINNSQTSDITYSMKWDAVTNGFDSADQKNLTFTATAEMGWDKNTLQAEGASDKKDPAAGTFPTADETAFVTDQTLKPGEKVTYTIHVSYKYDELLEQDSKGQNFTGKLKIDDKSIRAKTHKAA